MRTEATVFPSPALPGSGSRGRGKKPPLSRFLSTPPGAKDIFTLNALFVNYKCEKNELQVVRTSFGICSSCATLLIENLSKIDP